MHPLCLICRLLQVKTTFGKTTFQSAKPERGRGIWHTSYIHNIFIIHVGYLHNKNSTLKGFLFLSIVTLFDWICNWQISFVPQICRGNICLSAKCKTLRKICQRLYCYATLQRKPLYATRRSCGDLDLV